MHFTASRWLLHWSFAKILFRCYSIKILFSYIYIVPDFKNLVLHRRQLYRSVWVCDCTICDFLSLIYIAREYGIRICFCRSQNMFGLLFRYRQLQKWRFVRYKHENPNLLKSFLTFITPYKSLFTSTVRFHRLLSIKDFELPWYFLHTYQRYDKELKFIKSQGNSRSLMLNKLWNLTAEVNKNL